MPKDSLQIPVPELPSNLEQINFKRVIALYWAYGEDQIPVSGNSRHYSDLNLHAKTKNYQQGEMIEIQLEIDDGIIRSYQGQPDILIKIPVTEDQVKNELNGKKRGLYHDS